MRVLGETKDAFENVKIYCENGNSPLAKAETEKLKTEWENNRFIIEVTLDRSSVKEIESAVKTLERLIAVNKTAQAQEVCDKAKCEIEYLIEKERVTLENVL